MAFVNGRQVDTATDKELLSQHVAGDPLIGRGRLIADMPIQELMQRSSSSHVRVASPRATELTPLLTAAGATISAADDGALIVTNMEAAQIGDIAAASGLPLHELAPRRASLEAAFMELTRDSVQYHAGDGFTPDETAVLEAVGAASEDGSR